VSALIEGLSAMFALRCAQKGLGWRVEWAHGLRHHEDRASLAPPSGHWYTFEVLDTGIGIPPEEQAMILAPFTQGEAGATAGGTGLGLAIAQKHIELMGGRLCLDSTPGQGSRFWFTVPLQPATSGVSQPPIAAARRIVHLAPGQRVKAVVADDVTENRDVLSLILCAIGVDVCTAQHGRHAIEVSRAVRPDIVFMDIRMPATRRV
jgi:CheY-like chemotaxis protein